MGATRGYFSAKSGVNALAALAQTPDPRQTLRDIAQRLEQIPDLERQRNLTAVTEIISGLALEKTVIQQLLRSDIRHIRKPKRLAT